MGVVKVDLDDEKKSLHRYLNYQPINGSTMLLACERGRPGRDGRVKVRAESVKDARKSSSNVPTNLLILHVGPVRGNGRPA